MGEYHPPEYKAYYISERKKNMYKKELYEKVIKENNPREVDLNDWVEFGGGFMGRSFYNKNDDSIMMKIYNEFVDPIMIARENKVAKAVKDMGIPTPEPGDLVRCDKLLGVTFKTVKNKKSMARAISENPEKVEEHAINFAKAAKYLHSIKGDGNIFPDVKDYFREQLKVNDYLNNDQKNKITKLLDSIEDRKTCLHGDLSPGNIIYNEKGEIMFIDLSDFMYGNPMFDIGTTYLACVDTIDEAAKNIFHCSHDLLYKFWKKFIREYFGVSTDKEIEEIEREASTYLGIKFIFFINQEGINPFLEEKINKLLLSKL